MDLQTLLINLVLYLFLPLWGIAGFVDWCCHRATRIEHTSGFKETFMHSMMGVQIAIPILLCLLFEVNVLILLICLAALVLHELVAHWDVHYASPRRKISLVEVHAHNYLATLPLYMLSIIFVLNWPVTLKLLSLDWGGEFYFKSIDAPHGGEGYLAIYLGFMSIACVFPYFEEFIRCGWVALKKRRQELPGAEGMSR